MATIEDVAKYAGVSVATVSRVLNGTGSVSRQKAALVQKAIEALDFRPNPSGRNLRRSETKTLLVVCSAAVDAVLSGVFDAAGRAGYRVIVNYVSRVREQMLSYIDEFFVGNVDGALLYGSFCNDAELVRIARRTPVVQCCSYVDLPNAFRVSVDEERAGYDITMHLLEQGRRRVGFLSLDMPGIPEAFSIQRERGYRRALAEYGLPWDPALSMVCTSGYQHGYAAGQQFARMDQRPDALFCVQDILAYGAMQAILDSGLNVPRDIAVAGFDNFQIAQISRPAITTISQPFYELGSVATQMLVSRIRGEITVGQQLYLKHELIVRGSTVSD